MAIKSFYSRGKLLITGEYLVLHGAKALAAPVKFGQQLHFSPRHGSRELHWKTFVRQELWFECSFSLVSNEIVANNDGKHSFFISSLLNAARNINPDFLAAEGGSVLTQIDFDISWGLGSSSSLISNVAYWAGIDPFELHRAVSNGSGYDIACARSYSPITFQLIDEKPSYEPVTFRPVFHTQMYFVYSGQKQNSQESVSNFVRQPFANPEMITVISKITEELIAASAAGKVDEFVRLIDEHERLTGHLLGQKTLKETKFASFEGTVKSLGAWGGDFIMMLWPYPDTEPSEFLRAKGYHTWFAFDELVYDSLQSD